LTFNRDIPLKGHPEGKCHTLEFFLKDFLKDIEAKKLQG